MRAILLLLLALATASAVAQPERKVAKVGVVLYYDEQLARRAGLVVETLRERGWIEGHNVQYFFRSAERNLEGIEELVRMPVDVLVVFGNDIAREAVKRSRTIQVVVGTADYPIESGLVPSLSRPGGQITGVNNWVGRSLDAKRLALLKEAVPILSRIAVVGPRWMREWPETQAAAKALGIELIDIGIGTPPTELDSAFERAVAEGANGVFVTDYPLAFRPDHVAKTCELAIKHRLPLMHSVPSAAARGALIVYASDVLEARRRMASLVDRILRGARAGDLPFEDPAKLVLAINAKTAKAIGLKLPEAILIQADRIID